MDVAWKWENIFNLSITCKSVYHESKALEELVTQCQKVSNKYEIFKGSLENGMHMIYE